MPVRYVNEDLTGQDFREIDCSAGRVAHCDLTRVKFGLCVGTNFCGSRGTLIDFNGADITNSTFERSDASVLPWLTGAVWGGNTVTKVSKWLIQDDLYWAFATDQFVQIGCMQKSWSDWLTVCATRDSLTILNANNPPAHLIVDLDASWSWWTQYHDKIQQWLDQEV